MLIVTLDKYCARFCSGVWCNPINTFCKDGYKVVGFVQRNVLMILLKLVATARGIFCVIRFGVLGKEIAWNGECLADLHIYKLYLLVIDGLWVMSKEIAFSSSLFFFFSVLKRFEPGVHVSAGPRLLHGERKTLYICGSLRCKCRFSFSYQLPLIVKNSFFHQHVRFVFPLFPPEERNWK